MSDRLASSGRYRTSKTACDHPAFNLDFRDSFLERQHVNVWGINAGIEFGAKRHQLTLGYYWINYATYLRLIDWRRDAAQRINLGYYTRTDMWFMSLLYWWNMTNNRRWMVSLPVELGGGVAYALPLNLSQNAQIDRSRRDFFVPLQAGAYAQWKATRWLGLSAQVGYRVSVFQTAIDQNFNGSYYSIGVTIYPALPMDIWRWIRKKDRISPLHPPQAPKIMSEKPVTPKLTLHQVVMLVLSVYVVIALLIRELVPIDDQGRQILDQIDTGICIYFLYDFFLRLYRAPDKWAFLRWGWIDLLASIPALDWFRLGQLVRVFRILRMVRSFRSIRDFLNYFFRDRANGTLAVVLLSSVLLMIFGAIAILYAERVPEANIKTPSDALWWAFVTITTVGYGDKFPVTTFGRLIAAVLMVAGVGLFGTFTGYVANFFVEDDQQQTDSDMQTLISEVRQLRQKIEEMEKRGNG